MTRPWDVVIVGAGMTGSLVAERLREAGRRVLLLEAGPKPGRERVGEVDRRAWAFRTAQLGYDWYRVRAVGGRTHLWGGWCQRLPDHVFERAGWPIRARDLEPGISEVERWLGVRVGVLDQRYARLARSLDLRISPKSGALFDDGRVWTPLHLLSARRARPHHVALRLETHGRRATALSALDLRTETTRSVRANAFVLAASPIETTRILLASSNSDRHPAIGRNLVDHMVASYAGPPHLTQPKSRPGPRAHSWGPIRLACGVGRCSLRRGPVSA